MRKQIILLKYHPNFAPQCRLVEFGCVNRQPINVEFAAFDAAKRVDTTQNGRLAGAGRADNTNDLAAVHGQRYIRQDDVSAVLFADVAQFDERFALSQVHA